MPRNENNKGSGAPARRGTAQRYVVDECEISDFIGSLKVTEVRSVAARFQVVADLTSGAFEERIDQLDESDLALITRIASEDKGASYQRLMKAMLAGIREGQSGINAAHLTASRIVEFAFRCTREYFSALHCYRRNLRLGLLNRSARVSHAGGRSRAAGQR